MKAYRLFKIASIIVMLLGIIHCSATPFVLTAWKVLPESEYITCIYMFLCTGLAFLFIGWLQFFMLNKEMFDPKNRIILKVGIWFILIMGIGAVSLMWNNPFAYIAFFIALIELFCLKSLTEKRQGI